MKQFLFVSLSLCIFFNVSHAGNQLTAKQHKAQLQAAATEKGPYARYDRWPKDYFLIPQNLPFMVGLSLYQPGHESIGLSPEQVAAIHRIRNSTVPAVLKMADRIKKKELELANKLVDQRVAPGELAGLVDEIADLRAELTKAHMRCIRDVQEVITDEKQYARLLEHARKAARHHKNQHEGNKK